MMRQAADPIDGRDEKVYSDEFQSANNKIDHSVHPPEREALSEGTVDKQFQGNQSTRMNNRI